MIVVSPKYVFFMLSPSMGEQYLWVDRVEVLRRLKRIWKQNQMEGIARTMAPQRLEWLRDRCKMQGACFRLGFNNITKIFLSLKEKLKRKRIKNDEDITKDKLDNNEGKVYPLLHIFHWKYLIFVSYAVKKIVTGTLSLPGECSSKLLN